MPPVEPTTADTLMVLLGIMVAGAFGGFVDGLVTGRVYHLRLGRHHWDIGSVGDALIGVASSLAIFTLAGTIFTLDWANIAQPQHVVRLVAWGVLSGYAGPRLLNPLTEKVVKSLASDAAKVAVNQLSARNIEVEIGLRDADRQLTKFDLQRDELIKNNKQNDLKNTLGAVLKQYEMVLEADSTNAEAIRGKAKVYRRRAELATEPAEKKENWDKAIQILNDMIAADKGAVLAYYNRACYRCCSSGAEVDVLSDLRTAITANPSLKEYARTDPDFKTIHGNKEFSELVGIPPNT